MALSNAERQRRYRDRAKAALRNSREASHPVTLPEALARMYAAIPDDDIVAAGPDRLVAEDMGHVLNILHAVQLDPVPGMEAASAPALAVLGGVEYLRAVLEWQERAKVISRKRKANTAEPLLPPPVPFVT